ncbi:hypothetical protein ACXR2U_18420 [Jatrophihabitans sp. YIM 134969]
MDASDRPDDAMDTGSDAGAPGDHLPDAPLTDDERVVLADLLVTESDPEVAAVEDTAGAVEADSPLPALGPGGDDADPDTPVFRAAD